MEIQAQNDAGYEAEVTRRGGRAQDNRSERDKQKHEQFFNIANRAKRRDEEDEDDTNSLKAMGFSGSPFDRNAMDAGASAAARLLGKSPSGSAHYAATTAARPANRSPMRESVPAATSLSSPDASYAAGRASALKLLGQDAIKAEIDSDLRERFAMQQRERTQP